MNRQPNTEYILSLSYGKDSIACLEAVKQLGYPLDRIIHAEVWATDTIPADLPPMVEFKKYADKIIKDRYGIEVEHICATYRGGYAPTNGNSTNCGLIKPEMISACMDSQSQKDNGVPQSSKQSLLNPLEKATYEKLFYHVPNRRTGGGDRIYGFPGRNHLHCNSALKRNVLGGATKRVPLYKEQLVQEAQNPILALPFRISPIAQRAKN